MGYSEYPQTKRMYGKYNKISKHFSTVIFGRWPLSTLKKVVAYFLDTLMKDKDGFGKYTMSCYHWSY